MDLKPHLSQLQDIRTVSQFQSCPTSYLRMTQAKLPPLLIQLFDDCPSSQKTTWLLRFDSDVLALG